MLNSDDRRAIEGLFSRVADVERQNPHRDPDAERLIDQEIVRRPSAPYYLAQTVLVQEHALEVAERRIRELEQQVEANGRRSRDDRPRGPWDRNDQNDERYDRRGGFGGGGFLAGAAQTAMGVAGGVLLGSAIGSLFGGGSAHAAEGNNDSQSDNNADTGNDQGNDAGNDQDLGGDAGDFGGGDGGFDMGGDF